MPRELLGRGSVRSLLMGQEAAFVAPGRVAGHQESHHLLTSEGCSEEDP